MFGNLLVGPKEHQIVFLGAKMYKEVVRGSEKDKFDPKKAGSAPGDRT